MCIVVGNMLMFVIMGVFTSINISTILQFFYKVDPWK